MTVELSDDQYGAAMFALKKIATGGEYTDRGFRRFTKEEMVNMAREVCDAWRLPYGQKDSLGRYKAELAELERRT